MAEPDCIWPAGAVLGEAPYWCAAESALFWVDIDGRRVMRLDPGNGERRTYDVGHEVGCIVKRAGGGFVAGLDSGIARLDGDLGNIEIIADPEAACPLTRFNDGKCDRRGRFWVASTDRAETDPVGSLYRLDDGGRAERVLPGVVVGNGIGWSPDDRTMYFTDSGYGTIYAFDFDIETGEISGKRPFYTVDKGTGMPDGLTVDAEGGIWSAHWGGGRVTRYDPDGSIDRVVTLPVPLVTSLAFGGAGLDRLYITTARLGLSDRQVSEAPLSGGLFVFDAGTRGLPETPYEG